MNLDNKVIKKIKGLEQDSDRVVILFQDGTFLTQYHDQDCCEDVRVEQVDSCIERFIGATCFELQEKVVEIGDAEFPRDIEGCEESCTATFYTLVTSKGRLDWRWVGESNGYYSERVESNLE